MDQTFSMSTVKAKGGVPVVIMIQSWLHLIVADFRADRVLQWILSSSSLRNMLRKVGNILNETNLAQQAV